MRPNTARQSVVLPEPLGPMTPTNSPISMDKEISWSAMTPGKPKVAWSNWMIGLDDSDTKNSGSFRR